MEIRKISQKGINFLIKEEGIVLKPYLCGGNVPTIGIGCSFYSDGRRVKMTDPAITKDQAVRIFKEVLAHYESKVARVTRDDITQNQFDALVSLCYNIGTTAFDGSTVLRLVNKNPNDPEIRKAFEAWKNAGGKPILLARRQREYSMFQRNNNG